MFNSISMIPRNQAAGDRTREILGLPEGVEWSELRVEFGLDLPGTVTLTLFVTGEQVRDLAQLAIRELGNSCSSEETHIDAVVVAHDYTPGEFAQEVASFYGVPDDGIECPNCTSLDREDCMDPQGH